MKRLFFVLFSLTLILGSCGSSESKDIKIGREAYQKYYKKVLKDPSSFVVYSENYVVDPSKPFFVEWTIDYGAKNSFGGMNRVQDSFTTTSAGYLIINGKTYTDKDLE